MIRNLTKVYDCSGKHSLITLKEAARYLRMHPVSVRRLVSRGILKPKYRIGKTVLLLQKDLGERKLWGKKHLPEPPPWIKNDLAASISIKKRGRSQAGEWRKIKDFSWADIPLIQEGIARKYPNASFKIRIECFDDSRWELNYRPGKKALWKAWKGSVWLAG